MGKPEDPVVPSVTFDAYVIPNTVTREARKTRKQPVLPVSGMMMAAGTIAILTFALGVMATLKFSGPSVQMAAPAALVDAIAAVPVAAAAPEPAQSVTRQQAPDLISPSSTALKDSAEASLPNLETAVLRGLEVKRTVGKLTQDEMVQRAIEAQAIVNRNKLRMLREGVLAGIYSVKAHEDGGVKRLVLTTLNAEMSRASMANLLREAEARGEIEIPASLSATNGSIDMDTMLFNLIQTSLMLDGTSAGAEAAREMSRRAFAASNAKTREVKGARVYTVEAGDSLAYISLQFYGRPNAYLRIFEANREQLKSPDLIRTGQRLIIPG